MTKEELLDSFCQRTGHELDDMTRSLWLAQPMGAFMAKLVEWGGWHECGGKVVFDGRRT